MIRAEGAAERAGDAPGPRRPLSFGVSVVPAAADLDEIRAVVARAEAVGLELVGIQDHPYQRRFLDTFALIGTLLAETKRLRFFPDVANLPLRPPAMIAKAAASLDLLSGGRFELGIGAGAFWEGVHAMGGPVRTPGESVEALEEAIEVIRPAWSRERSASFSGEHYRLEGYKPGPAPAHPIGIWVGAYKPRMLRLVGRRADGWVPSLARSSPEALRESHARIDAAAREARRDPAAVRRLLNVSGTIGDGAGAAGSEVGSLGDGISGPPARWIETVAGLARDGFDTFILWPGEPRAEQVERFAREVVPGVRGALR
jgi:alkanesulfonate monooxygenase SsuD/methylene tetrahydromethanopterin reductase-like flavin-dependent oxidoreductase (luciferase family)